jgi:hypothetical protein
LLSHSPATHPLLVYRSVRAFEIFFFELLPSYVGFPVTGAIGDLDCFPAIFRSLSEVDWKAFLSPCTTKVFEKLRSQNQSFCHKVAYSGNQIILEECQTMHPRIISLPLLRLIWDFSKSFPAQCLTQTYPRVTRRSGPPCDRSLSWFCKYSSRTLPLRTSIGQEYKYASPISDNRISLPGSRSTQLLTH